MSYWRSGHKIYHQRRCHRRYDGQPKREVTVMRLDKSRHPMHVRAKHGAHTPWLIILVSCLLFGSNR